MFLELHSLVRIDRCSRISAAQERPRHLVKPMVWKVWGRTHSHDRALVKRSSSDDTRAWCMLEIAGEAEMRDPQKLHPRTTNQSKVDTVGANAARLVRQMPTLVPPGCDCLPCHGS
eukprot:2271902-Amphidinium_carterae.2